MNSCEFQQPLDLRLKALNLSISSCQQQQCLGSKANNNNNNINISSRSIAQSSNCSVSGSSSASTSANSLISHQSYSSLPDYNQLPPVAPSTGNLNAQPPVSLPPHHYAHQAHPQPQAFQLPPPGPHYPHPHHRHQLSQPSLSAYHQNQHQSAPPPTVSSSPPHPSTFKQQQQHPSYQHQPIQHVQHQQRSLHSPLTASSPSVGAQQRPINTTTATIHCQPLNHQQPHPLASRFHSSTSSSSQPPPNQASLIVGAASAPTSSPSHHAKQLAAHSTPSISHPGSPHHPATCNSQHQLPAFPVKSFSVSSHHHLLACSSGSPGSFPSGPPTSGAQLNRSSPADASHLSSLEGSVQQAVMKAAFRASNSGQPPIAQHCNSARAPPMGSNLGQHHQHQHHSQPQQDQQHHMRRELAGVASQNQPVITVGDQSAPPITRQHSLVSRYNCKPCGIVFSQPETLRAHQEGYCTKRDRTQAQIRSQSAVSPSAVVTEQHLATHKATPAANQAKPAN